MGGADKVTPLHLDRVHQMTYLKMIGEFDPTCLIEREMRPKSRYPNGGPVRKVIRKPGPNVAMTESATDAEKSSAEKAPPQKQTTSATPSETPSETPSVTPSVTTPKVPAKKPPPAKPTAPTPVIQHGFDKDLRKSDRMKIPEKEPPQIAPSKAKATRKEHPDVAPAKEGPSTSTLGGAKVGKTPVKTPAGITAENLAAGLRAAKRKIDDNDSDAAMDAEIFAGENSKYKVKPGQKAAKKVPVLIWPDKDSFKDPIEMLPYIYNALGK